MKLLLSFILFIELLITLAFSASAQTLGDNYPLPSTGTLRLRQATGTGGAGSNAPSTGITLGAIPINLDFLTNIPFATDYTQAKFGVSAGIKFISGNLENLLKADIYVKTNFMFGVEIQNAPSASVIDSAAVFGGYRKAWSNAEIYAQVGGRRWWSTTFTEPRYEGVGLLGASWSIFGQSLKSFADMEVDIHDFHHSAGLGFRGGLKYLF